MLSIDKFFKAETPKVVVPLPTEEDKLYNPLDLKIGDFVDLSLPPYIGKPLIVSELDEYSRSDDKFIHYVLMDNDFQPITLKVVPGDGDPFMSKTPCQYMLLRFDSDMIYNPDFHKQVLPTGHLEIKDGEDKVLGEYGRLSGLKEPYTVSVKVLTKSNVPPVIEHFQYWDYKDYKGEDKYYFVEMSSKTGFFQMYNGQPITSAQLTYVRNRGQ